MAEATAHKHFRQLYHQKEWFRVTGNQVADWAENTVKWRLRAADSPGDLDHPHRPQHDPRLRSL